MRFLDKHTLPNLASAPGSPVGGQVYYNTTDGAVYGYDAVAAAWKKLTNDGSGTGAVVQSFFDELTVDTTTTSTTFVDLLTRAITTDATNILVLVTAGASNTNSDKFVAFRITVDGVAVRAVSSTGKSNNAETHAILCKKAVSAGAHTVKLQWKVEVNTGQIRPVAAVDTEHCSMQTQEVM